jgi:hypothetical protein
MSKRSLMSGPDESSIDVVRKAAAVIDKEDGKPHVVKRMDRPHIRVIPEWFGGGALPRKELHEAAEQLTAAQCAVTRVAGPGGGDALTARHPGGAGRSGPAATPARPARRAPLCHHPTPG